MRKTDPEQRFWRKVSGPDERGCLIWQAAKNPKGYGSFVLTRERTISAHRYAWTLARGDPGSKFVLHICDNPSCVNIQHLFLGDHWANANDCTAKKRDANKRKSLARGRETVIIRKTERWEPARVIAEPLWGKPSHEWPVHKIRAEVKEKLGYTYSPKTFSNRLGRREDAQNR